MSAIIEVNHLSKHFRDIRAVDDLSFTVERGDVYGFLGQNGAGKSTTIRMLLTLIRPTAGTIRIFGKELAGNRRHILQKTGAVIERPDLYKYLTAFENLALFAKMSGVKPSKLQLMEQLELVGIRDRADSKVKTFSQGMKQRLGIAVALVHDPELIILDEPTNGLDPQGIADVRNLILHLSRNLGKTIVVSSHLLTEIEMVASRMLIIDKGTSKAEGSVAELFDPSKTLVELETNDVSHAVTLLKSGPYAPNLKSYSGSTIKFQVEKTQIPKLANYLVSINVDIISLQAKHSLEDYFLSLTTANQHVDAFAN
ncbi:ABC transporter ATP-binding protein [Flavitalea antarctica]